MVPAPALAGAVSLNGQNGTGQVNLQNANGAVTLYVGGSLPFTPTTPLGTYTGTIHITANYQ